MSLSEVIVKLIGVVLAVVGLALILSVLGISFLGVHLQPWWAAVIVGVILLGAGIYVIRGGNLTV
jgi:hypothetical protein